MPARHGHWPLIETRYHDLLSVFQNRLAGRWIDERRGQATLPGDVAGGEVQCAVYPAAEVARTRVKSLRWAGTGDDPKIRIVQIGNIEIPWRTIPGYSGWRFKDRRSFYRIPNFGCTW